MLGRWVCKPEAVDNLQTGNPEKTLTQRHYASSNGSDLVGFDGGSGGFLNPLILCYSNFLLTYQIDFQSLENLGLEMERS